MPDEPTGPKFGGSRASGRNSVRHLVDIYPVDNCCACFIAYSYRALCRHSTIRNVCRYTTL